MSSRDCRQKDEIEAWSQSFCILKYRHCLLAAALSLSSLCSYSVIYRVAQKSNPKSSAHNFVKYWPIFIILTLSQSPEYLGEVRWVIYWSLYCKLPRECDSGRIFKIGQYLTKLCVKYLAVTFLAYPVSGLTMLLNSSQLFSLQV